MVSRTHLPALLLVGLGLLVAVPAGAQVADGIVVEYTHSVERVDPSATDDPIRDYDRFSDRERWAFDTATAAPDGTATVRSLTRRPDSGYAGDATAETFVRHDGTVYRLRSSVDTGPFVLGIFGPLLAIGLALLSVGVVGLRSERPRLPTAILAGTATAVLVVTAGGIDLVLASASPWPARAFVGLVLGVSAGTWLLLRRRHRQTAGQTR